MEALASVLVSIGGAGTIVVGSAVVMGIISGIKVSWGPALGIFIPSFGFFLLGFYLHQ